MKQKLIPLMLGLSMAVTGCHQMGNTYGTLELDAGADKQGHVAPTQATADMNAKVLGELPFDNMEDFEQAKRGLIASDPDLRVAGPSEDEWAWNQEEYAFVKGDAPASVNPSLWRQAKLNNIHGLFKVMDGIYQLRGFDLSNMSIIEGKTGWILVDPMTSKETAQRALSFARKHLGNKPVSAVIFTHSHIDHFGGALGVVSEEDLKSGKVQVIAPEGFVEESTSENILAGPTMARRAGYMYGRRLARTERGHVGTGLGKTPAFGTIGILEPTHIVEKTPQPMMVDGVEFVFHNVPGSEAPAELVFYLPGKKAFCGAEVVSRNMHNLYTLRGAKVRNALAWSQYIDDARLAFPETETYFASHHWPIWGKDKFQDFMKKQRDTYKYIHDQTLRLAHSGYTPKEIADKLVMPESLRTTFASRGYYGTVRHNSRAVYQGYYGWFDGNPANLNPHQPEEAGKRYVEFMGGAENVLTQAQAYYDKGDYRWVAEVLNHLVFADPKNVKARALLAKAYDQMGYQSESGPWRDVYLTGAYELRHNRPEKGTDFKIAKDMVMHTPIEKFFDAMAARIDGEKADGVDLTINFTFTDLNETHVVYIENAVLHHYIGEPVADADATVTVDHETYIDLALQITTPKDAISADKMEVDGLLSLLKFNSLQVKPDMTFDIVLP